MYKKQGRGRQWGCRTIKVGLCYCIATFESLQNGIGSFKKSKKYILISNTVWVFPYFLHNADLAGT